MAQTHLNDEAGDTLRRVAGDIDGALRYIDGDAIKKEYVQAWADDLRKVLAGQVTYPRAKRTTGGKASGA